MSFAALMYHEIRKNGEHVPGQSSPIEVRQDYHDNLPDPLFVTLENFEEQMKYLFDNQFHTLTLQEVKDFYYDGKKLPERSVLLTFDDCYQSIRQYAYSVLKKYNFHAAAFVVTGWLNTEKKPFIPEISVFFEYANHTDKLHTRTHDEVSMIMEVTDEEFSEDLDKCNENEIVAVKDVFAYPFGFYIQRNAEFLKGKGFKLAFTSDAGLNEKSTDPMYLKRNAIPYFIDMDAFKRIIK
jgi:hypothetical protein